jgi:hypothetical protein
MPRTSRNVDSSATALVRLWTLPLGRWRAPRTLGCGGGSLIFGPRSPNPPRRVDPFLAFGSLSRTVGCW